MDHLRRIVSVIRVGWFHALALFLFLAVQGYGEPVLTKDLSGPWRFTPIGGSPSTIQVPGGGWYKQGFADIVEADYETSIAIPSIGRAQVTRLEFGAVNYQADLYINDRFVGSSIQSFTPAEFDISDHVEPGKTCNIRVHVKGRKAFMENAKSLLPNAAGWSPNTAQGIFRSARLVVYPQVYISDVFVKPSVENSNFYYDVWLHNGAADARRITLSGNLQSWNGDAWSYPALPSQSVALAPGATTRITVGPVDWDLGTDSYWWPNVPYRPGYMASLHLLNLMISPAEEGEPMDRTAVRFGFRELLQKSDGTNTCYFLNGVRVNFRGDNLAGANYDSIDHGGGKGDAFGTLPGFLPGTNGWPKAVENYQRLNYNFVRLHQEPATPYMLDVCDEMGLMLMEETAIRGSNDDQDFVKGHDHMVNHVKALFARDRNHPSIVRQSLGNDPDWSSTDSVQFQTDLYHAAMEVDGTRPLSIDSATQTYESMNYPNFSVYRHFGIGRQFGQYTEEVFARPDRPYGEGAFIGNNSNTRQGFCWFATGTQAMRAKGASDIRPFSLMEAWAGIIPGVATPDMELEQAGTALFGEDNLVDPWDEPLIQRVQQAFSPVLVADVDYWESVKRSNSNGDWPASIPVLLPGQSLVRTLRIYNDTFSGTAVDVFWELRKDTPTGPMAVSGVVNAAVPLGYSITRDIGFTVPAVPNGTMYYLVLYAGKGGKEVFREVSECFMVSQPTIPESRLTGRVFGSEADGSAVSGCANATDGDPDTYYECKDPDGGHVGIDLGEDHAARVGVVVFSPREGYADTMLGGVFRGSMDGLHYNTFHTITTLPAEKTVVEVNSHQAYRYLAYFGPEGSRCNIAEMDFYANNDKPLAGTPFGTFPAYAPGSEYNNASDGKVETFFDYANANGGYVGIDLGEDHAQRVRYIVYTSRFNFEWRMVGGQFRGSNDGFNWTTLHTINAVPPVANNVTVRIDTTETFRYLLYMGPDESYCNIAEISFY